MTSYRPGIATVPPPTLEKQLEVLAAARSLATQDDEFWRRRRAEIAAIRRILGELVVLRLELQRQHGEFVELIQEERRQRDPRLRSHVIKYNPDQPRIPAGSPHGGEWTSGEGGSAIDAGSAPLAPAPQPSGRGPQYAALDPGTRTDASPAAAATTQVAAGPGQSGYPIDLLEEEQRGGHTIAQHVGKSSQFLSSIITDQEIRSQRHGDLAQGLKEGSFTSLEAANKLVNSTVASNQTEVNLVASGLLPIAIVDAKFSSPTGYEAFAKTERSTPYIRDTYGVRVIIVRDPSSPKGYRVLTAFPMNF
jgi:hypothetical protein